MTWKDIKTNSPKLFGKRVKVSDYILVTDGSSLSLAYLRQDSYHEPEWVISGCLGGTQVTKDSITHWTKIPQPPKDKE